MMIRIATTALVSALVLLVAAPASAQYSYSGSASNYRSAPPQNRNKAAGFATKQPAAPVRPTGPGMSTTNRTGAAMAPARTDGKPPAVPTRTRTPMTVPPGQARPVVGIQAPPG